MTAPDRWDDRKTILLSYHYFKGKNLVNVVTERFGRPVPRIFLDSGAWSAFASGVKVKLDDYIRFCHDNAEVLWVYSNLDNMESGPKTAANQVEMERQGLRPVPTFHTGDDWSLLEDYCARYDYVALGKIIPYTNRHEVIIPWIKRAFDVAGTRTRFHGFGVSNVVLMKLFPWHTCDSSSWMAAYRYGGIPLWDEASATMLNIDTKHKRKFYAENRHLFVAHGYDLWPIFAQNKYGLREAGPMGAVAYIRLSQWLARVRRYPFALHLASGAGDLQHIAKAYEFLFPPTQAAA